MDTLQGQVREIDVFEKALLLQRRLSNFAVRYCYGLRIFENAENGKRISFTYNFAKMFFFIDSKIMFIK